MFLKTAIAATIALTTVAAPARANETATTTQITSAVDADGNGKARGDSEFRELFASWKAMDRGAVAAAPYAAVSLPAGMPVHDMTLTSGYGMRTHPILRRRSAHKGVDLAAPTGTPVYATADGLVSRASRFGSYGNYIQIEHGGDLETRFAHLSDYTVQAGDRVTKGQLIGYVGSTGRSTGPHLHYEVRVAGEAVDPTPYMVGTQMAVAEVNGAKGGPE